MKQILIKICFLFSIFIYGNCDSFCDSVNFQLEWVDEFDGQDLDLSKWSRVCQDDSECMDPFPTHASNDHGAECRSAYCMFNYTYVNNGLLTLKSSRNPLNESEWFTGAIKTKNKITWTTNDGTYRLCVLAKLPGGGSSYHAGQGIWPAHWMMPNDDSCDPDEGEMDIFEMVSGTGVAESTYHWQNNWPNDTCTYPDGHEEIWGEMDLGSDWANDFHEFSVERGADHIAFAVDGIVIVNSSNYIPPTSSATSSATSTSHETTTTDDDPAANIKLWPMPFYLILNSAIGGGWPGEPDNNTVSPTYHIIDSVKVVREII